MSVPEISNKQTIASSHSKLLTPIAIHRLTIVSIYLIAFLAALRIYQIPETKSSIIAILANGSIFGTMGSAIMTMFGLWEKDLAHDSGMVDDACRPSRRVV